MVGIKCSANYANEANEGHTKSGYDDYENLSDWGNEKDNAWVENKSVGIKKFCMLKLKKIKILIKIFYMGLYENYVKLLSEEYLW